MFKLNKSGVRLFRFQSEEKDVTKMSKRNAMVVAMATCHSLTIIEEKMTGDPLDLKMFEATKWVTKLSFLIIHVCWWFTGKVHG